MDTFGKRFKTLRKEKGLTQKDLAEDFNQKNHFSFNKSSISQYESNKRVPEMDTLKLWSEYFCVSLDWLLGITDSKEKDKDIVKIDSQMLLDISDLPKEAINLINEFVAFVRQKYGCSKD